MAAAHRSVYRATAKNPCRHDVSSNDLAINFRGEIYFTDPQNKRSGLSTPKEQARLNEGILFPKECAFHRPRVLNGGGHVERWVWFFQCSRWSLANGVPFFPAGDSG